MQTASARALAATLLVTLAAGCASILDLPDPGVALERGTQRSVLACQKNVNRQEDDLVIDSIAELGGLACGVDLEAVGSMLFVQTPRHADAIRT